MFKPRTALQRICLYEPCGQSFWIEPARARTGRGLFCTKSCWRAHQALGHILCHCAYEPCGKSFTIAPNVQRNGRGTFCSRRCIALAQRITLPLADRLWPLIASCAHGKDCLYCCWPWQGARWKTGYGRISVNRKDFTTSRLIWEVWNQRIMPADLDAAHHCNNPPCNNPHHIYAGTPSQNAQDAVRSGRWYHGPTPGNPKLTKGDIPDIFRFVAAGMRVTDIAAMKHVTGECIYAVLRGQTWKHVSRDPAP
jgi:hypothetical protein